MDHTFRILKYLLGWPFSILAFVFIAKIIGPHIPQFLGNIHSINYLFLLYGILCFIGFYFLRSYIWHALLKVYSKEIPYKKSSYYWAISELKRYIPGNLWSFLGRAVLFSEYKIKKKDTGRLLISEAIIFILGGAIVSILSLPFIAAYFLPFLNNLHQFLIIWVILAVVVLYIFNRKITKFLPDYGSYEIFVQLFLSIVALFLFGIANYFVITSFVNLPLTLIFQLCGYFVLSFIVGYLSLLAPAGFGVREAMMIGGVSKFASVTTSAFVALFSRVILIVSELIFVALLYILHKTKNRFVLQVYDWVSDHKQESILLLLAIIYIAYFATASFARYDNFYAGRFDLGNMAQTVWNTTRGRMFLFTNPNGTGMVSRLAFHADFMLILLAPVYAVFPNPKTLLFIQAFVVSAGSFFVYRIATDKLNNKNIALAFSASYLLNPSIQRATLYDFHSVTLATTFLLAAYYFYSKKNYSVFAIFAILAALCKEQVWLIVALFGGLIALRKKTRMFGSSLFLLSLGMFYYLVSVAIPHALGSRHFALTYYSEFGDGPLAIIKSILLNPQKILILVLEKSRINYLVQLFAPIGYSSLFSPLYLIFAVPDLLINLLSNNSQLHQIYYHYTSAITPFIFISAILGVKIFRKLFPKVHFTLIVVYLMSMAVLGAYQFGPLPGSMDSNIDMFTKPVEDREFIDRYLSSIPRRLSVASSNNIGSHLSQRQQIYTLPLGIDKADILVFLLNNSESQQSIEQEKVQLKNIRKDKNYEIAVEKGSFVVFRKKKI